MPDSATDKECEEACSEACEIIISNEFDTGWNEITNTGGEQNEPEGS